MGILGDIIGIGTSIIGGNKTKKVANQGFNWAKDSPLATNYLARGSTANDMLANALGMGDDPDAAATAFDAFQNSAGFDWLLDQGSRAITGNAAARGLLQSGATTKALTGYGQKLGQQYFTNWLANVGRMADAGQQAGNTIANAGVASSQAASKAEQRKWDGISQGLNNLFG
jgi:hypothetical protein